MEWVVVELVRHLPQLVLRRLLLLLLLDKGDVVGIL
jgi:hypothetical protein